MTPKSPISEEAIRPGDSQTIPWDEAAKRLAEAGTFWIATVRPDGLPHVRPILAVWVDGALHFASSISARKSAYFAQSPGCSISTETPGLDLVIEGHAVRVVDDETLQRVANAYDAKYKWPVEIRDAAFFAEGAPTAGPPPFYVYRVQPSTVFGFGTDDDHSDRSTRWRFLARSPLENQA